MSESRRAKVLRRTRVGGTLALALAGLLWLAGRPGGGWVVLTVSVVATVGGVVEAGRMGLLGRARDASCLAPGLVALAAGVMMLVGARREDAPALLAAIGDAGPAMELSAATAVALIAGLVAALPRLGSHIQPLGLWGYAGCLAWLVIPLPAIWIVHQDLGAGGLTALVVLSKVGDIAGYYVGNALGDRFPHHPFPRTSPNKTAVGCWASLLAGTLAGGLFVMGDVLGAARFGVLSGLAAGALVNVASQAGDLLESRAKRFCGVKDSAATFGPSGGFLDLVDSLLLSVPTALLTWPLLFDW